MAFPSPKNEVAGTITGDGQPEKGAMRRGRALAIGLPASITAVSGGNSAPKPAFPHSRVLDRIRPQAVIDPAPASRPVLPHNRPSTRATARSARSHAVAAVSSGGGIW